jgi:hypothetical protein
MKKVSNEEMQLFEHNIEIEKGFRRKLKEHLTRYGHQLIFII